MGFRKGMLGKFVSKEQANINKGKGKKRKIEEPPPPKKKEVFPKDVDDKKQSKMMEFSQGRQKKNKENKQNRKKTTLKTGLFFTN